MEFDWTTLALQTVNAGVLIWLLSRLLLRPVADVIARRQKSARELLEGAAATRAAAEAERAATGRLREAIDAERASLMDAARRDAEAERARLAEAARLQAQAQRDETARALERERREALQAWRSDAVSLSADFVGRLLARSPGAVELLTASLVDQVCDAPQRLSVLRPAASPADEPASEAASAPGDEPRPEPQRLPESERQLQPGSTPPPEPQPQPETEPQLETEPRPETEPQPAPQPVRPLRVTLASEIDAGRRERLERTLREAGLDAPLDWAIDPSLLAGVQVVAEHGSLSNHWGADLGRLRDAASGTAAPEPMRATS